METLMFRLQQSIDGVPSRMARTARDYLAEDRLSRRVRHGTHSFSGELRGYQDQYHPAAAVDIEELTFTLTCSCERRQPCSHTAALLMDMERHALAYPEVPWDVIRQSLFDGLWHWDAAFPWHLVPDTIPSWRVGYRPEVWPRVAATLANQGFIPVARDPRWRIWAEADASWWEQPEFEQAFRGWVSSARLMSADPVLCAALLWMQPALPLAPLIDTGLMSRVALTAPLMGWLFHPQPILASSPARQLRALESLTLAAPDAAGFLWAEFRKVDPHYLGQADALYLAGRRRQAVQLMEQHLPSDPMARRAARRRLIDWLDPEAGIPHRTALALETGQLELLVPVRRLIGDAEWRSLEAAVRTRAAAADAESGRA